MKSPPVIASLNQPPFVIASLNEVKAKQSQIPYLFILLCSLCGSFLCYSTSLLSLLSLRSNLPSISALSAVKSNYFPLFRKSLSCKTLKLLRGKFVAYTSKNIFQVRLRPNLISHLSRIKMVTSFYREGKT